MGEKQNQPFQLSFNALLKVDFQGSRVTSHGGVSGEETGAGKPSSAAPQKGQNERQYHPKEARTPCLTRRGGRNRVLDQGRSSRRKFRLNSRKRLAEARTTVQT